MAEAKKPNFPSKECPKCKALIHARSQSHEKCGWVMRKSADTKTAPAAAKKKVGRPVGSKNKKIGRPAGVSNNGGISLADIEAVKALTDRIGAKKVVELAQVLA